MIAESTSAIKDQPAGAKGHPLSIEWFRTADEIPTEFWRTCFPPPAEGHWMYRALDRAGLDSQFKFIYGVILEAGKAGGIVPAFVMDFPLEIMAPDWADRFLRALGRISKRLSHLRTLFVGSPCTDEGAIGLLPGAALKPLVPFIQKEIERLAVREKASFIVWKDFPERDWEALDALAATRGAFKVMGFPNTRMMLHGPDFEDYLMHIPVAKRTKLRRKLKRSRAMGPLESLVVQRPGPEALGEMFALFRQTYMKGKVKFEELNLEFFAQIARHDEVFFVALRDPARGRLVAFALCFLAGPRVVSKFIGIDYAYSGDWYLYFRLWEAECEWGVRMGATEIQSGQTCYAPKFDIGLQPIPLRHYCRHRNPLVNRALRWVAADIDWNSLDDGLKDYVKAHGTPAL